MTSHRSGQSSAIHNEMRPARRAIKFEVVKKKLMRSSSVLMFTIQSATDSGSLQTYFSLLGGQN